MPSHIFSVQTVGGTVKDSSALPIALSQAMHEMTAVQGGLSAGQGPSSTLWLRTRQPSH